MSTGRTYNQDHIARPYKKGQRRFSVYWSWSYPWEANRDITQMENRFSTMTEVRRVAWPNYENAEWGAAQFLQGIAGTLGLDDITVRSDGTAGAVVRVGKRFAENFYAAYERSLSGAMGTLFIFYDVSQRVTVRAEAGERTGLDLIFTFAFDRIGGKR